MTLDANFCGAPSLTKATVGGWYWVVTVKGNRRKARDGVEALPWADQPTVIDRTETLHGRTSRIKVKAITNPDLDNLPIEGMTTVIQIHRNTQRPNNSTRGAKKSHRAANRRRQANTETVAGRTTRRGGTYKQCDETTYIVTSCPPGDNPAAELYGMSRGHWGTENKNHYIRDTAFREDASQIRTGTAPRFMAALNHFAISLIRLTEGIHPNIRAATRKAATKIEYAISLITPLRQ